MHIHTERHTQKGKLNLRNCQENNTDETRRYLKYHMQFCFPHLKTDLLEKAERRAVRIIADMCGFWMNN